MAARKAAQRILGRPQTLMANCILMGRPMPGPAEVWWTKRESTLAQKPGFSSSSVTTRFWQMAITFSLMERISPSW